MDDALRRQLLASFIHLNQGWRYRLDPERRGLALGYAAPASDDHDWPLCQAGQTLEQLGQGEYRGLLWLRRTVELPAEWAGSPVSLVSNGIRQCYRLYLDGRLIGGHGAPPEQAPDQSVAEALTRLELGAQLQPGRCQTLALAVECWSEPGGLWGNLFLQRQLPLPRDHLPRPLGLPPGLDRLYWSAWELAWQHMAAGSPENGFEPLYLDEAFNEHIYQWDSCFMSLFLAYGPEAFPALAALDNFYGKQRADGYIQRMYKETSGRIVYPESPLDPAINPPLFAWVERHYAEASGDDSRLQRVYPALERYYHWLEAHVRHPTAALYWQTEWGSGQDNTPRPPIPGGWADMSAQMALFADALAWIARHLGRPEAAEDWQARRHQIAEAINRHLWSERRGCYVDVDQDLRSPEVAHIGGLWVLLAGVVPPARLARLVEALEDPARFGRPHPFPSLAADEPAYDPRGNYWRGGVWAPTTYMVIKGLERTGHHALAAAAARRHVDLMAEVLDRGVAAERLHPLQRDHGADDLYHTIWECYSPEQAEPATDAGGVWLGRHDFVGWSGLGPIALMIEQVLGLRPRGLERRLEWHLPAVVERPLGIAGLRLWPGNRVSLRLEPAGDHQLELQVTAEAPFTLTLARDGNSLSLALPAGPSRQLVRVAPGESG